jgi:hypothetical protein
MLCRVNAHLNHAIVQPIKSPFYLLNMRQQHLHNARALRLWRLLGRWWRWIRHGSLFLLG